MTANHDLQGGFVLDRKTGYFQNKGVDVMAFDDIYPSGHQSGVSILMHGMRVAANGDVRFEPTPGQWQPVPRQGERTVDANAGRIVTRLRYPDVDSHLKGFNPRIYPDYAFEYSVTVQACGPSVSVTVDLDKPVPAEYAGRLFFNLELFPGALFGKPWIMDHKQGIFPPQPNGPVMTRPGNYLLTEHLPETEFGIGRVRADGENREYNPLIADDVIAEPYASGRRFTVRPDDPYSRFTIESLTCPLRLYDGRMNHNNGWFVISSEIPASADKGAIQWIITPNVVEDWLYPPVVQTSQVGYHPDQPKIAVIELDKRDEKRETLSLLRITADGEEELTPPPLREWGCFLRYRYLQADFSSVKEEGLYKIRYGASESSVFRIAADLYDRGVWQPVLEYFLPVQMCHMRVNEKYRVWHGLCHNDDARMAPVNYNHIDGYMQGPSTLTKYKSGDVVPGLNAGGWHDAGDFDLRIESQAGEIYLLALVYETFHVYYDATTVDQAKKVTEIHQPDGKNDILQQLEHGVLSVVGAYRSLGRLYRGIICRDLRQYVLLGDSAAMTDGIAGNTDDRLVFTEDNPPRELTCAAQLAAAARALRGFHDALSADTLAVAEELYEITAESAETELPKVHAAAELYLSTGEKKYRDFLLAKTDFITENIEHTGWIACRVIKELDDDTFTAAVSKAVKGLKTHYDELSLETPYGIPYRPRIWGAGWEILRMGCRYYFLHRAFPDTFGPELLFSSLNFILGCHPGSNPSSFASGVGARSATTAYGLNRADWSYIPGGVVSGTALIRPDFPELLDFPFLWQQMEYMISGGASHYMFLVLAVQQLLREEK